jgi:succinyl-CoA synthetase beta subunit
MKIHEYQAREIFRQYGLPVPPDRVAETAEQAEAAARSTSEGAARPAE